MAAGSSLREMLEREFPVDDLAYPWGTELATVEAALERRLSESGRPAMTRPFGGHRTGFGVLVTSVLGIPTVRQTVWAPAPHLPVVWVTFDLAPQQGLEGAPGLAMIRPMFDRALDEEPERGFLATGKPNPYLVAAQWTSGSTRVHLSNSFKPRDFLDGSTRIWSAGTLRIERDELSLMQPYVQAKLRPQPWDHPAGDVEVIDAPGLKTGSRESSVDRAVATAVDQYVTPQWVADRLGPQQVAIWTHQAAGVWGFGDARLSRVLAIDDRGEFKHWRFRAARGAGSSTLSPSITAPGPAGLDAAAQALARRGALVREVEYDDE